MTAERSSEHNDSHQVRATTGLAGGYALQCRLVRHHEAVSGSLAPRTSILAIAGFSASGAKASSDISAAATRPERWALRPASFAPGFRGLSEGFIDSKHCSRGSRVPPSMVCRGVNFRALASLTGRHQLSHVVRIDHEFLGRSVVEDLICVDCQLQRDHLVAPASSRALRGSVSSNCSKPSVTRMATLKGCLGHDLAPFQSWCSERQFAGAVAQAPALESKLSRLTASAGRHRPSVVRRDPVPETDSPCTPSRRRRNRSSDRRR